MIDEEQRNNPVFREFFRTEGLLNIQMFVNILFSLIAATATVTLSSQEMGGAVPPILATLAGVGGFNEAFRRYVTKPQHERAVTGLLQQKNLPFPIDTIRTR